MQQTRQPQPVIRTYRGQDRRAAEEAYRIDAAQAAKASWFPVAHRWVDDWNGSALSVVFELREGSLGATASPPATSPAAQPSAAGQPTVAGQPGPQPADATPQPSRPPSAAARAHARTTMQAIDLHCAGEPLRLIRTGFPQVPHAPILERRRWVHDNADVARRIAIFEPRGHRDMYGAILLPPFRPDADVAVLFMHNEGYSTMCGHGIIALTTALIEERLFPVASVETTIRFEAPAGLVTARAQVRADGRAGPEVERVRFTNVPSYLAARDIPLRPEGIELAGPVATTGMLRADLAFGGAYYGIVAAADLGLRVIPAQLERLRRAGAAITDLLRRQQRPIHPTDPDLSYVYGTIIVDEVPASSPDGRARDADIRNVTIFADAEVDRSPCGSGTSALLAQRLARGRVTPGQDLVNAGITGESFRGRVEGPAMLGTQDAVETSVEGSAYVTGYPQLIVDDRDPLGEGFLLH
jgi:proline racemase